MVESFLADREVLYFLKQDDCEACAAAKPELDKFAVKHPGMMILVLDANGPHPDRLGLKIKATPTYFFRRGDEGITREGTMKEKEIERWIKKAGGEL